MRPRLYVVDEPLANLDPATAERLLRAPPRRSPTRATRSSSSSTASRRRSSCGPIGSCTSTTADPRTSAPVDGFLEVADPERGQAAVRGRCSRGSARELDVGGRRSRATAPSRDDGRPAGPSDRGRATAAPRVPRRPRRLRRRARSSTASTRRFGRARDRRRPRPERLRQDDAVPDRDAASCRPTDGEVLVDGGRSRERTVAQLADRLRLRLPEPQPDAVRPDGPRGAAVRAAEPRARPRPTSTRSSTTCLRRTSLDDARGHPRAAAADALVRPAEAARPRDRPRAPARRR